MVWPKKNVVFQRKPIAKTAVMLLQNVNFGRYPVKFAKNKCENLQNASENCFENFLFSKVKNTQYFSRQNQLCQRSLLKQTYWMLNQLG